MTALLTLGLESGDPNSILTQGLLTGFYLITIKPKPIALIFDQSKPIAIVTFL